MLRALLFVMFGLIAIPVFAASETCTSLASRAEGTQGGFYPPAEAKVIGTGKLSFYEAPSVKCKIQKIYTEPGSYLTVYKIHNGWANVMFVPNDAEDLVAWVPSNRLNLIGQYGRYP